MTAPRITRRTTLGLLASVGLAGCSLEAGGYWANPPSFDDAGLAGVLDEPAPARPDPLPIDVDDVRRSAFAERVATLLDPIPEPLTEEILPNGEIRAAIVEPRSAARAAIDEMADARDALSALQAAVDAGEAAGTAAGTWAAVTTTGSPAAIPPGKASIESRTERLRESIPGVATGPAAGALVYGTVGERVESATARVRGSSIADEPDPLHVGRAVGTREHAHFELEAAEYVQTTYVDSIADSRSIEATLSAAATDLTSRIRDRFERYRESGPGEKTVGSLVERDYQQGEPAIQLLAHQLYGFYEAARRPLPPADGTVEYPALAVRDAYWALANVAAIDRLLARIAEGDDLFPADAATVTEARTGAIEAIETAASSTSPLGEWVAWRLVPALREADATIDSLADVDRREIATAHTEYRWLEWVAGAVPDVEATVADAFDAAGTA